MHLGLQQLSELLSIPLQASEDRSSLENVAKSPLPGTNNSSGLRNLSNDDGAFNQISVPTFSRESEQFTQVDGHTGHTGYAMHLGKETFTIEDNSCKLLRMLSTNEFSTLLVFDLDSTKIKVIP